MQHLYSFSRICVNRDHFHNIAVCMDNFSKTQSQTFSVFSTSLLQNKLRFLADAKSITVKIGKISIYN